MRYGGFLLAELFDSLPNSIPLGSTTTARKRAKPPHLLVGRWGVFFNYFKMYREVIYEKHFHLFTNVTFCDIMYKTFGGVNYEKTNKFNQPSLSYKEKTYW